jgi:hypothetical protein
MFSGLVILVLLLFIPFTQLVTGNGNNTQNWSHYTEPENRFKLKYPASWQLGEEFDIMNPEGIKFYVTAQDKLMSNEIMQVGIGHRDLSLSTSSMKNITKLRLDSALYMNKFKGDLQNFSLQNYPDFDKYRLDGHRSFSFEFTFLKSNIEKKGVFVATDIGNSIFYVLFTTDLNQYDKMLPVIENVVASTQIEQSRF